MSNYSFNKRWSNHFILLFIFTLSLFISVNCAHAAIAPDANRTFTHPAEDNQTKNLTLTPDTYTFRTDADPNGGHYVQWYNTYSGTVNCLEEEYLYYYDDHDFSFSSSGSYWVRAEIYDSNWNWQAAYRWYVTVGNPDLIVEDIWLSPSSPVEDEEYTFYARVKNVGNAAAGASETGFYVDGSELYWHINTPALGVNDSTDVAYDNLTAPSAGSHTFKAVADIDTAVAESNENNNDDYSESITVEEPLNPDYIVTKITIDDEDTNIKVTPSDRVRLDFWVKNVGDAKGGSSTLRWWYGTSEGDMNVYIGEGSIAGINGLAIGEEEQESDFTWSVPELDTGQYYLVAKADADEEVDEGFEENNNTLSLPFYVFHRMEPSYSKGDFEYSPELGDASDAETSICGRIPIVLVHGDNGDKKPASLNYWYWWIEHYFNLYANAGKFKVYRYVYNSYDHIGEDKDPPVLAENGDENATRFADFVNGFDEFQGKKIIIMAHSMGGLVVRSALNNNAELREKTLKLITLGTPHLGTPAANPTWAMSLPSGQDLLLTTLGPLFFDGTPGDFDLAWHDTNEMPIDVTSTDAINALLLLIAYDWDLLSDSLISPYTGEIGESYLSDDYILAFGGYLGLSWISSELYDSAPQEVKEELDGDHGKCWLLHAVLADFEKSDGSNFWHTDGPVPLESAMFDSHPSVNSINITDSAVLDEHLDHSSYLDLAQIMDYIMTYIVNLAENADPPNVNPINDHATIGGEPYNGPMPSLTQHVLPVAWSLVEGPAGMDIDFCTGVVSWSNPTVSGSPHNVTIRATNASGSDDESWEVTATSIVEAPVIALISHHSTAEGTPYTGPTPTLSEGTFPVTWSLVNNPVGMTIDPSTGVVSWTNPTITGSPHTITIRATNVAGSDDESWEVTVTSIVEAPVIALISDHSTAEGTPYTGPTPTLSEGTFPVTWSLVNNPVGMTIDPSTGVVSWTNPTITGSPHTITICATNSTGSDEELWALTVNPSDTTPPTPSPMTWSTGPYAAGQTSIRMVATTASDISGVEYYFDETTGNPGGNDSGWQASNEYTDTGLNPNTSYSYRVKARDKSENQNETAYSAVGSATTQTSAVTRIAVVNPDTYRILKMGELSGDSEVVNFYSIASGEVADYGDLTNPADWTGVGEHQDFISSVLTDLGYEVDPFEASDLPAITKADYQIVIVQDPLRTNARSFSKDSENSLPDLLEYTTDATFLAKLEAYFDSGGQVIFVGDAVRLMEDGAGRLSWGKSVVDRSILNNPSQADPRIPDHWLFIRGNPFCGVNRQGSGQYTVNSSDLLESGAILSDITLYDGNDMPRSICWSDTFYYPEDGVSLLSVDIVGSGDYVLSGAICNPEVYTVTVDETFSHFIGYTYHDSRKVFYLGSDSFFDYHYVNNEGAWHGGESRYIQNIVTESGRNALDELVKYVLDYNEVTLADAISVLQLLVGTTPATSIERIEEINNDGRIGLEEVIYIMQKVSELR